MKNDNLTEEIQELALKLAKISKQGQLKAIGTGDTSVGMTLLQYLDIPYSSTNKPNFKGITITARRGVRAKSFNRVNLFAKVPDWSLSACKSSAEILDRYGYYRDGGKKLYCTVNARQPNNQGLFLVVDSSSGLLYEKHINVDQAKNLVATWRLGDLKRKLEKNHMATAWVVAVPYLKNGVEYFHFRYVTLTSKPKISEFNNLIEQGTITMDHLIWKQEGRVVEKGPLFKIKPKNVEALFPVSAKLDLLNI